MLVYLDSAQFAHLENATLEDRVAFFEAWRARGCELVLTLHHLQEIGQLPTDASVRRRLAVLEDFPAIRGGQATEDLLLRFEIQLQCYAVLGFSPDIRRSALDGLFPENSASSIAKDTIVGAPLFRFMRTAHEQESDAWNAGKAAESMGRLNLSKAIDPERVSAIDSDSLLDEASSASPHVRGWLASLFSVIQHSILSLSSPRRALEHLFDLADVAVLKSIPDADLSQAAMFYSTAREEAPKVLARLGLEAGTAEELVCELSPYSAPGFSLRMAVLRARRQHPKPDKPGDPVDSAHVCFAPYVDLLLADRRTVGFVEQEIRDRPALVARGSATSVRRSVPLNRLTEMLRTGEVSA